MLQGKELFVKKHQWWSVKVRSKNRETVLRPAKNILYDKHPLGTEPKPCILLEDDSNPVNPNLFDILDANAICQATLHIQGAAAPTGLDANACMLLLQICLQQPLCGPCQHWTTHCNQLGQFTWPCCICCLSSNSTQQVPMS